MTFEHIYLPHWPAMAIQYQCDIFHDIIYCSGVAGCLLHGRWRSRRVKYGLFVAFSGGGGASLLRGRCSIGLFCGHCIEGGDLVGFSSGGGAGPVRGHYRGQRAKYGEFVVFSSGGGAGLLRGPCLQGDVGLLRGRCPESGELVRFSSAGGIGLSCGCWRSRCAKYGKFDVVSSSGGGAGLLHGHCPEDGAGLLPISLGSEAAAAA